MSFTELTVPKDSNALEEHQHMYLFVYKTTHVNGKYYIGRHQTEDLNDGYLGSGKWVKGIKDKSTLIKEIVAEASSLEELCELEEYYINLHWDNPLCMNMIKGSKGLTSEDSIQKVENGTHPFLTRSDGTNIQSIRVKARTHNLLKRPDGTSLGKENSKKRIENGTHHFLTRPDGTSHATDRVKKGTHHFLTRPDGTSVASDKVEKGTHPFLTRPDGTSIQIDKVKNGTHHLLGNISCINKDGVTKSISKEQYHSQTGPMEDWEWVFITSKEGKKRKSI
jgi:hypothetical protein